MIADHHIPDVRLAHRRRRAGSEYRIYFAVIFVLALVPAFAGWAAAALANRRTSPGVVARALSEARSITPVIFSA